MKTPYGFPIIDDCMSCGVISKEGFCDLPDNSRAVWNRMRHNATYPREAVLFVQDQPASGMYFICMGQVKLSSSADCGHTIIHRICSPGEVLGLAETVLGSPYEASAETISPCMLNFVKRDDLIKLIRTDPGISSRAVRHLSLQLTAACRQLQNQRFRESATGRLACFLLSSCNQQLRVSLSLTHEEIGNVIGLARETVTRALRELKNRNIIRITGHLITVIDRDALTALARQ